MADTLTPAQRRRCMQAIRSKDTKPEVRLRSALRKAKIKFKGNVNTIVGKPDFVITNKKVVVFVDGEFWHGYEWKKKKRTIRKNKKYWVAKIERNICRDKKYNLQLRKTGWKVVRFWQHQIERDTDKCIAKIKKMVKTA